MLGTNDGYLLVLQIHEILNICFVVIWPLNLEQGLRDFKYIYQGRINMVREINLFAAKESFKIVLLVSFKFFPCLS